ncbi:unnamed protein product [Mytilus coruscus]|uniref:Endonuclease/exonuclease/phosphatase domain-containing protein n=1 Tax=Mytilus coruscus TaxID=42192 RepID=A0A6J8AIU8_MYTCO|nr:unnamed protein product [Mytilus coruscus]
MNKTCSHDIAKSATSSVKQYQSICKQWELKQMSKSCCHDIAKCATSSVKQYQSICKQWELEQMSKVCCHDIAKSATSSVKQYQSICEQWELEQMSKTCCHDIAKSATISNKQYQSICKQWELEQMSKTCCHDIAKSATKDSGGKAREYQTTTDMEEGELGASFEEDVDDNDYHDSMRSDKRLFEDKPVNQEAIEMEKEIEVLLKSPPKKRPAMKMYADELEGEIQAKNQTDLLEIIEKDITDSFGYNGDILLVGDLNARTGSEKDYIDGETTSHVPIFDENYDIDCFTDERVS